jgi:FkbM family methyltransferase
MSVAGARAETSVAELLDAMRREARELERAPIESKSAVSANLQPLVLFGAGPLAQMTLAHLRRVGLKPLAVADNNEKRWGTKLDGVRIISPQSAAQLYGAAARFVVTIYNGSAVRRQLVQLGCKHVSHFADLYFEHADEFLPYCGLAPRNVAIEAWADVAGAAAIWQDAHSTREYLAQLAWRLRLPHSELPAHDPPAECYFPRGLFEFSPDEVFFDCGAFDGDSLRQYLARRPPGGSVDIVAFEPDAGSAARLAEFVAALPDGLAQRVQIEPCAVADKSGEVRFSALGSVRSGVAESGGCSVKALAIDDMAKEPTLIKMDVEGFELSALRGAAKVIRRRLPVLAISLYHHARDLWEIPNFLRALAPDYNLFLRRYAEDCWELVLYAVPSSRLVGAGTNP